MKVRYASPAGLKAGRSVGSFRLKIFAAALRAAGRSGQPESVADAPVGKVGRSVGAFRLNFLPPRCARRSVGRVVPTQILLPRALRVVVGRSGCSDPIFFVAALCAAGRSVGKSTKFEPQHHPSPARMLSSEEVQIASGRPELNWMN